MGGLDDHPNVRGGGARPGQSPQRPKLKLLLLLVSTNLLSVYLFSGATLHLHWPVRNPDDDALLRSLNLTRASLADLRSRCAASSALLETLLAELGRAHGDRRSPDNDDPLSGWPDEPTPELKLATGPHKLPLGFTSQLGADELYPPLGFACRFFQDDVAKYLSYDAPGADCPSDDAFAQRLMLRGCEPLPRRRCKPKSPAGYAEPAALPGSLWTTPPDSTVNWEPFTCKNYSCLVNRGRTRVSADCKDCFDLGGRERLRWLADNGALDFGMDEVLRAKPKGTIRIGLDIGGGTGTFAARMRERGVTVVTTTMDFDAPFNRFIASRGLVPLHMSVAHRLPFADGVLDLVHSMHVLSNWIPDAMLELALFDVYRVLRPGGLFWLDHFFCLGGQLNGTYVPMLERVGFRKRRWAAGRKLDRGVEKNEWYLSALLEKPMS